MPNSGLKDLRETIKKHYEKGATDYWIKPLVECREGQPVGRISDGDTVIFCCRRGEREVQLMEAFVEKGFSSFPVKRFANLRFLPLVEYHEKFADIEPVITPVRPSVTLAGILSSKGLKQLAVTETEKQSHVTFFFNGRRSRLYDGQIAEIIPSWRDFGSHPEMKSAEIGNSVVKAMDRCDFMIINFPAGDVIGHLEDMKLKIRAAEEVDKALGKIFRQAMDLGRTLIVTADHGLMERGKNEDGSPSVSHTTAKVPFVLVNRKLENQKMELGEGTLADVAPTVLSLMGIERPEEMTGSSLIKVVPSSNGVVLVILDGWGEGADDPSINPLKAADTPNLDYLKSNFPFTRLIASGEKVGLPIGRSGNSETGHLTIGAGRVIEQDELRLMKAMEVGLVDNPQIKAAIEGKALDGKVHVIGVLSESSSHGNIHELIAVCEAARLNGAGRIFVHLILDGRSAPPRGAVDLLDKYESKLAGCEVVGAVGRGFALDRSRDYIEKTKLVYDSLVNGTGECYFGL